MRLHLFAAAVMCVTSSVLAQMPLPAFLTNFSLTRSSGFWFQCPVDCVVTGLSVPNITTPTQVIEFIGYGNSEPPNIPGSTIGTQLFYDNTTAAQSFIPVSIPLVAGEYYGVIGCGYPFVGAVNSQVPISSLTGSFTSSILGIPTTISRLRTATSIGPGGGQQSSADINGVISRVNVFISSTTSTIAANWPLGEGCVREASSFYEKHTAFDLSNTSLEMSLVGSTYLALPGTTPITAPAGPPTAMSDDQVLSFPLGWSLPYAGGSTTQLWISSNGFVNLTNNSNSGCCGFGPAQLNQFLTNGPVFAAKWSDLNPSGGTVTFESDPVAMTATITFQGVYDSGQTTNLNNFQYHFDASGTVEFRFGNCAATRGCTGWSPGMASPDPGSIDISAAPVIITSTNDIDPLVLSPDSRPVLGTSWDLTVSDIPTNTVFGVTIFGTSDPMLLDLGFLGMPGCQLRSALDDVVGPWTPTGSSQSYSLAVPAGPPALIGRELFTQAATFANPAVNTFGAITSNGIKCRLGDL